MTLDELIDIADAAYGEGLVRMSHDTPDESHGGTLALFIACELEATFTPDDDNEDQLRDARKAIETAIGQLQSVAAAFETELTTETAHLTRGETK